MCVGKRAKEKREKYYGTEGVASWEFLISKIFSQSQTFITKQYKTFETILKVRKVILP